MKIILLLTMLYFPAGVFSQVNTWNDLNTPGPLPGSRDSHNMVWDSANRRAILYGGHGGSTLGTWAYDYAANTWTDMNPATNPGARAEYGMCYLSRHDRIILFKLDTLPNNSTWEYDYNANTWINLLPAVSPALDQFNQLARVAYDSESDRVIFADNTTGKVWAYDYAGNLWTDMNPPAPKPATDWRQVTAVAYDSNHDRVIVATPFYQETWEYDYNTNTWQQKGPAPNVTLTGGGIYDMDYDAANDKMIMYGDDQVTWAYDYDSDTWNNMNAAPSPQAHHHAICYMEQYGRFLFYGGIVGDNDNTLEYVYDTLSAVMSPGNRGENFQVTVSPNPSGKSFRIIIHAERQGKFLVSLYDSMGRAVRAIETDERITQVDFLTPGFYSYRVCGRGNNCAVGKVIATGE